MSRALGLSISQVFLLMCVRKKKFGVVNASEAKTETELMILSEAALNLPLEKCIIFN